MIIYWKTLEKDGADVTTIPQYISSGYVPSVHFARNIYWESQPLGSGRNLKVPDYISSGYVPSVHFARNIYWESQKQENGKSITVSDYISAGYMPKVLITDKSQEIYNKIIGTTNLISFNSPQGFPINHKIVVSVASDELTVAIKGLNGNDPSESNPVYCRIGDTVRSIKEALSVTRVAGVNWFNSARAELATKEIDYFVYLFWYSNNTTPKVGIGISRMPYARILSEVNTTDGTVENYMGYSYDGSHLVDTSNSCTVIGRFAATLSAGADYHWSVPTFNTSNLINEPINYTRRLDGVGFPIPVSGSFTNVTATQKYQIVGRRCFSEVIFTFTNVGTGANGSYIYAPVSPSEIAIGVSREDNITGYLGLIKAATNGIIVVYGITAATWGSNGWVVKGSVNFPI